MKYDVVIVGAGPSGISTAISLKKLGIKHILVIDKSEFPRYKCCAGYITNKTRLAYEKFGLDINKINYSLIDDFKIIYKHKMKQTIKNKFLFTNASIDRVELDYNFFKLLKENKINTMEKTTVKELNSEDNYLILSNKKKVEYNYLVFADGTSGYGSSINPSKRKNIAMQAIVKSDLEDGINIHFGITKHGYAWISTLNNLTNVGITDIFDKNINYNDILIELAKAYNLKVTSKDIRGAFTPIGVVEPILENIYFVGDAVGACDPLTLSGLRYGLKSGEVCAEAISNNNPKIYSKYIKKLKFKFNIMSFIQKVFYLKFIQVLVFNVVCVIFKPLVSFVFNHFFVNKKWYTT